MDPVMIFVGLVFLVGVGLIGWFIASYNGLVRLRNQMEEAWAQIDVQLKRRHDLIPNLVETVKGYATHERETLEKVIQARNAAVNARGVDQQAKAENALTSALAGLNVVVERYPDLKANQNFLSLQEELTSTEKKVGFARTIYNDKVRGYNTKIQSIPDNIIAGMFNFDEAEYFEIEEPTQREAPKVQF